jgi:hypothetical protein
MAEAAGAGFGYAETFGAKLGAFAALFCASWLTGLTGKRREAVDAVCDPAVADETDAVVCEPADTFCAEMMPKAARASIIRSAAILMTMRMVSSLTALDSKERRDAALSNRNKIVAQR